MSQKIGLATFNQIIMPFMLFWFICFIISLINGLGWVYALPGISAFIFSIILRFYVMKKYQITESNGCIEFLLGFFCFPCSIAQSKFFLILIIIVYMIFNSFLFFIFNNKNIFIFMIF